MRMCVINISGDPVNAEVRIHTLFCRHHGYIMHCNLPIRTTYSIIQSVGSCFTSAWIKHLREHHPDCETSTV